MYLIDVVASRVADDVEEVHGAQEFSRSRWFTRGWTLQELLAPQKVEFFTTTWNYIGSRERMWEPISQVTGIDSAYLNGDLSLAMASIAEKMSWMTKRLTSRLEDMAYCLLGVFDISMPLLYGKGARSFVRLQEEILKVSDDQTIFCWEWIGMIVDPEWANVLAPCPAVFGNCGNFYSHVNHPSPYNVTNIGLSINLPIIRTTNTAFVLAILSVRHKSNHGQLVCIPLEVGPAYRRGPFPRKPLPILEYMAGVKSDIYIMCRARYSRDRDGNVLNSHLVTELFPYRPTFLAAFLLAFDSSITNTNCVVEYCDPGITFV